MRTLYVSDLDGTLLGSDREISRLTADTVNSFIDQGGLFTIATARMAYGCDYKLGRMKLNLPGIIMNGVCLYSFNERKYSEVQTIDKAKVEAIESILDGYDEAAFMYTYLDNEMSLFYKTQLGEDSQYLSARAKKACRDVAQVHSFHNTAKTRQVVYFALTGTREEMQLIWDKLQLIAGIQAVSYLNIYNGMYCLEIFDAKANKANALLKLKHLVTADEVVAFGDNHNDIEMMRAADFGFAPENAVPEVKRLADRIIESHDHDGVAKYISQKYGP